MLDLLFDEIGRLVGQFAGIEPDGGDLHVKGVAARWGEMQGNRGRICQRTGVYFPACGENEVQLSVARYCKFSSASSVVCCWRRRGNGF
jgi:hypothetical protein